MSAHSGRRLDTGDPLPPGGLEAEFRRIAREEAQAALRAALQDLPGSNPAQMTIARWARSRGHGYATARRWVKAAGLSPAPSGKYLSAELDTLPRASMAQASPVSDLAAARARRVAEGLLAPKPPKGVR